MTGRHAARGPRRDDSAARVEAAQRVLEERIEALAAGGDWQRYLEFQSKLHRYSPNNVMLIWAQHVAAFADGCVTAPEPSYVAGYRTWQALGRHVERGQRGYAVLAPVLVRRPGLDGEGGERRAPDTGEAPDSAETDSRQRVLQGFRVEHVFDVSQTSGHDLPEPVMPKLLTGQGPPGLRAAARALIEEQGFRVESVPSASTIGGANGVTEWHQARVRIRADMDDAAQVKTLIHEAGHVLLHRHPETQHMDRSRKEVEAESVAYIVAAAHGMATDDYSFPYVMAWAGTDPAAAVRATQARVSAAALRIIERSPAAHTAGGKPPALPRPIAASTAQPPIEPAPTRGAVPC